MMRIVQSCYEKKLTEWLDSGVGKKGSALILFNHGLGDLMLFIPLFNELCKAYRHWDFTLGMRPDKNFSYVHDKIKIVDVPYGKYGDDFDFIFNIQYPDAPRNEFMINYFSNLLPNVDIENISKPLLCNELEIGLRNFMWTPYKIKKRLLVRQYTEKIGIHFFGYSKANDKNVPIKLAEFIWNSLKEEGFEPFEIQMIPINHINIIEQLDFIKKDETLRYQFPNIKIMIKSIAECRCFIGIDSGPLYLSGSILGFDKIIALEKNRSIEKVCPYDMTKFNINNFNEESMKKIIDFIDILGEKE